MEKTAVIFDIGRFRNADGPGIRTILFFKGCPLSCPWCSNPFGLQRAPQLAVNPERCTGCGTCVTVCPKGANQIVDGKVAVDFSLCATCGACVVPCPADTRMITGKEYTARQLFQEANKDAAFYRRSRGGVTLSGGEVLLQYEVAAETLRLCRENGLHTCIETSGFAPWAHLEAVARYCDFVFIDWKDGNPQRHRELTGVPLEPILENITKLCQNAPSLGCKVVIRRPIIPGCNDDDATTIQCAQFVSKLPGCPELNLLPYHNLGELKYRMIGRTYSLTEQPMLDNHDALVTHILELSQQYAPQNRVSLGGDAIDLTGQ